MTYILDAIERKKEQSHQFDYMFRVEMPNLSMSTGGQIMEGIGDFIGGAIDYLTGARGAGGREVTVFGYGKQGAGGGNIEINHRVFSVNTPFPTIETFKNTERASFFYTAAHNGIGTLTASIDEMEDGATLKYITEWMNLIKNPDGTYNPPVEYKRDILVYMMSAATEDLHMLRYKNFFPTEISNASWSYEGGGVRQYEVVFTGDDVEYEFMSSGKVESLAQRAASELKDGSYAALGEAIMKNGVWSVVKEAAADWWK